MRDQDVQMSGIELQSPWGFCLHTTRRNVECGCLLSFNAPDAMIQDALKTPRALRKVAQSGRVEVDPDVGLLTVASFPPLAREAAKGE